MRQSESAPDDLAVLGHLQGLPGADVVMSALKDSEVVVVTRAEYEADLTKMAREGSLAACAALLAAFGAETDAGRVVQSMIETIETIEAKGKK